MEPIVEGIASPSGNNPVKIPNEDCRLSELDDLNLFFINRMSGYDRVDNGIRVVYGLNNSFYDRRYRSVSVFVGKSQRLNNRSVDLFGDYRKSSDLVIRSRLITAPWFKVHYRGRLDHKNYHPKLTEIGTNIGKPLLQLNTNYVFVKKTETLLNQDIHQLNWQLLSKVNDHWSLGFTQSRNLIKHQRANLAHMLNVSYENDCFKVTAGVYKTGYRDRDIRPDSGFLVQFNFKNLGTIQPLSTGSVPNISFRNLGV
jgi:LPS-assembly protein